MYLSRFSSSFIVFHEKVSIKMKQKYGRLREFLDFGKSAFGKLSRPQNAGICRGNAIHGCLRDSQAHISIPGASFYAILWSTCEPKHGKFMSKWVDFFQGFQTQICPFFYLRVLEAWNQRSASSGANFLYLYEAYSPWVSCFAMDMRRSKIVTIEKQMQIPNMYLIHNHVIIS